MIIHNPVSSWVSSVGRAKIQTSQVSMLGQSSSKSYQTGSVESKKSPTGPTERTPKPEYLIGVATYYRGPLVRSPSIFDGLKHLDASQTGFWNWTCTTKNHSFPQRFGWIFIGASARVFGKMSQHFCFPPCHCSPTGAQRYLQGEDWGGMFFFFGGGEYLGRMWRCVISL